MFRTIVSSCVGGLLSTPKTATEGASYLPPLQWNLYNHWQLLVQEYSVIQKT